MTVSSGESRRFVAGDIALIEDITGEGHTTKVIGNKMVYSLAIQQ